MIQLRSMRPSKSLVPSTWSVIIHPTSHLADPLQKLSQLSFDRKAEFGSLEARLDVFHLSVDAAICTYRQKLEDEIEEARDQDSFLECEAERYVSFHSCRSPLLTNVIFA